MINITHTVFNQPRKTTKQKKKQEKCSYASSILFFTKDDLCLGMALSWELTLKTFARLMSNCTFLTLKVIANLIIVLDYISQFEWYRPTITGFIS